MGKNIVVLQAVYRHLFHVFYGYSEFFRYAYYCFLRDQALVYILL